MASNKHVVPEAREALDRFKMEAASEVGVNLKQGYNGDLTSKQAGSVGGQMIKKMIKAYEEAITHLGMSTYIAYQLYSYYLRVDDLDTAIAYINDGLNCDDDMFTDKLLYNQVVYYEKILDYKKAFELMNELYKSDESNEEFRAEYDYLYTRVNINPNPVHVIEEEEEEEK